jgi:hypothetical protein
VARDVAAGDFALGTAVLVLLQDSVGTNCGVDSRCSFGVTPSGIPSAPYALTFRRNDSGVTSASTIDFFDGGVAGDDPDFFDVGVAGDDPRSSQLFADFNLVISLRICSNNCRPSSTVVPLLGFTGESLNS